MSDEILCTFCLAVDIMATITDYFPLKKKRGRAPKEQSNAGRKRRKPNADASTIARNDTQEPPQEPPQQSPVPPKVGSSQQTTGKRSRTSRISLSCYDCPTFQLIWIFARRNPIRYM